MFNLLLMPKWLQVLKNSYNLSLQDCISLYLIGSSVSSMKRNSKLWYQEDQLSTLKILGKIQSLLTTLKMIRLYFGSLKFSKNLECKKEQLSFNSLQAVPEFQSKVLKIYEEWMECKNSVFTESSSSRDCQEHIPASIN